MLSKFLDLIFPINCVSCKKSGSWICESCFSKLGIKNLQVCPKCKKTNKDGKHCKNCKNDYNLNGILIAGDYENYSIESLIKKYKYEFAKDISAYLGNFLFLFLEEIKKQDHPIFKNNYSIISVPLHKKRQAWRGFNQSEILAKIISKKLNLELLSGLKKVKNTNPQTTLNKEEREKNIKNCFEWTKNSIKTKNIIIIDDITTTGSTLNECAKELKKHGASDIWGLVIAKKA